MKTTNILGITTIIAIVFFLMVGAMTQVFAADFSPFTQSMSTGSRGSQVTKLQAFLAAEPIIYPSGSTDGKFGPMTRHAVAMFQDFMNLVPDGYAGRNTLAELNRINATNRVLDINPPAMYNLGQQINSNNATITWTTDTPARSAIIYSSSPLQLYNLNDKGMGFMNNYSGSNVAMTDANTYGNSQSINLSGLSSNTTYYYLLESIDVSGNLGIVLPPSFTTK